MTQIFVKEYKRKDGTVVNSHYRNIEGTAEKLAQGDNKGALDLIKETLPTIQEEKDALAELFTEKDISEEDKNALIQQIQGLQTYKSEAERYKVLAENNLDTSDSADKIKNLVTGGAAPANNKSELTLNENIGAYAMQVLPQKIYPLATEALRNGMNNLEPAKMLADGKNIIVLKNIKEIKNKNIINFLKELGVGKNTQGVIYSSNTDISRQISEAPEIIEYVKKHYDDINKGKIDKVNIEFKISQNIKEQDRYFAYQHITLVNPRIDAYGNFTADAIDFYDFEKRQEKNWYDVSNKVNNLGNTLQEKGAMTNYFSVIQVKTKVNR